MGEECDGGDAQAGHGDEEAFGFVEGTNQPRMRLEIPMPRAIMPCMGPLRMEAFKRSSLVSSAAPGALLSDCISHQRTRSWTSIMLTMKRKTLVL